MCEEGRCGLSCVEAESFSFEGGSGRSFVCYVRSNHLVKEVKLREKDFERAIAMVGEVLEVIQKGFYPDTTKYKTRCVDCTYRNICV